MSFLIKTDCAEWPAHLLRLRARCFREFEVQSLGSSLIQIPVNRPGTLSIKVVTRRAATADVSQDLSPPDEVVSVAPLTAQFVGEPLEELEDEGVLASSRVVEVKIDRIRRIGGQVAELGFRWNHDPSRIRSHAIRWTVLPAVESEPTALILDADSVGQERTLTIRSRGRPLRILKIAAPESISASIGEQSLGMEHQLRISVKRLRPIDAVLSELVVSTDHPDQAQLLIPILVQARAKGGDDEGGWTR